MKIESSRPTLPSTPGRRADGATGFSPILDDGAQPASAARPTSGVIATHGVLALQGLDDPAAKRARHVRRGRDSLDALDQLTLGLLDGRAPGALRTTLNRLLREREETDDPALNAVMDDIDVRVAVELAKLERSGI